VPRSTKKKRPRSSSWPPDHDHELGGYIRCMLVEKEDGKPLPKQDEEHLQDIHDALTDCLDRMDETKWPKPAVQTKKKSPCEAKPTKQPKPDAKQSQKNDRSPAVQTKPKKEAAKPEKDMVMKPMEIVGNSHGKSSGGRLRIVRIYSYGRKTLAQIGGYNHLPAVKRLRDHAHSHKNNFSAGLSVEAMRQVLRYREESDIAPIVLNCRNFFEDKASLMREADWHHTGKHPCNVQRLFQHKGGETMRELLKTLEKAVRYRQRTQKPKDPDMLDICLECNQGRDRSVGCAVALANAFSLSGWTVETTHLCESGWLKKEGCKRCAEEAQSWAEPHAGCPHCTVPTRSQAYVFRMIESGSFPGLHIPTTW
jgi:hypothetical protein